jgi:hypothetical protein
VDDYDDMIPGSMSDLSQSRRTITYSTTDAQVMLMVNRMTVVKKPKAAGHPFVRQRMLTTVGG